jgi:hypothetical protein
MSVVYGMCEYWTRSSSSAAKCGKVEEYLCVMHVVHCTFTKFCFRVTEFMALWKDIIQNPQHLNPHFSGYLITNYL